MPVSFNLRINSGNVYIQTHMTVSYETSILPMIVCNSLVWVNRIMGLSTLRIHALNLVAVLPVEQTSNRNRVKAEV